MLVWPLESHRQLQDPCTQFQNVFLYPHLITDSPNDLESHDDVP